jgi:VanZ family protein
MLPLSYPRRWRIAGILLLGLVLAFALTPDIWPWDRHKGPQWVSDKVLHGFTFAFLALWYSGQYGRNVYVRLSIGLLAFGAMIELCQLMVGYRDAEWGDLLADAVGILIGMTIAVAGAGGWSLAVEQRLPGRHE